MAKNGVPGPVAQSSAESEYNAACNVGMALANFRMLVHELLNEDPDTGAYIIYYQGGPIDHGTHVPGPVAKSSAESEYNSACTVGMALANFRMLVHELLNEYPDMVPKEAPLIVLDSKSAICMPKNGKDT